MELILEGKLLKSRFKIASLILGAAVLAGCASGTPISQSSAVATPPAPGQTRIVVYRQQFVGSAIQPQVSVNAVPTGKCTHNGVFVVDVPLGTHTLSASTEATTELQIDTFSSPIAYVKCSIGSGLFVGRPEFVQVPPRVGAAEIGNMVLTGTYSAP